MELFTHLLKPLARRRFKLALKEGRYETAASMCQTGKLADTAYSEVRFKQRLFNAIVSKHDTRDLKKIFSRVAAGCQNPTDLNALGSAEKTTLLLAQVAIVLETASLAQAMAIANTISDKEGRSEAIRKVAGHMAWQQYPLDDVLTTIQALPVPAYVNEELRHLLIARILNKDFKAARHILVRLTQNFRRGLRPQIDFVERHHSNLDNARDKARDLIDPDDIALTLALSAGAMEDFDHMFQFSQSVSAPLFVGTHLTYASSLAYAGKLTEAIALMENIRPHAHEYYLGLCKLALSYALTPEANKIMLSIFSSAGYHQGVLAFWYHLVAKDWVNGDVGNACARTEMIVNDELKDKLAVLLAELAYGVCYPE